MRKDTWSPTRIGWSWVASGAAKGILALAPPSGGAYSSSPLVWPYCGSAAESRGWFDRLYWVSASSGGRHTRLALLRCGCECGGKPPESHSVQQRAAARAAGLLWLRRGLGDAPSP
jgi:hypothetical protein